MNYITLNNLSMVTWYGAKLAVTDEKKKVLFSGYNYQLSSILYKDLVNRWIRSVGVDGDKMIITVI